MLCWAVKRADRVPEGLTSMAVRFWFRLLVDFAHANPPGRKYCRKNRSGSGQRNGGLGTEDLKL